MASGQVVNIRLTVVDEGTEKVMNFKKSIEDTGATIESTRSRSESSRLGFFALGNAVENTAASFGVASQASRQLGNSVERVAMRAFPAWGSALGWAVMGGMTAVSVITNLIDRNARLTEEAKKAAEATIRQKDEVLKSTTAAADWLEQADKSVQKSEALTRATAELYAAERNLNLLKLDQGIFAQEQRILDLKSKNMAYVVLGEGAARIALRSQTELNAATAIEIAYEEKKLALWRERRSASEGPTKVSDFAGVTNYGPSEEAFRKYSQEQLAWKLEHEVSYAQAMDNLWATENDQYSGRLAMQQEVFDRATTAKLTAMSVAGASAEQIRAEYAVREIQFITIQAKREQDIEKAKLTVQQNYQQAAFQTMSNGLNNYAAATNKNAKTVFLAMKALAMAQIWVDTGRAAQSAAASAAILGPEAAIAASAAMWQLGYANLALVAATAAIGYSNVGGGGATGTYNVNSVSGQPTASYRPPDPYYEQYGSGARPGEGQWQRDRGGDVHYHINGDVYSQDEDAFKRKVVKAACQNIADQGELNDTIQRYPMGRSIY